MHEILIIDDDSISTKILSSILSNESYSITCINNPKDVAQFIENKIPNLILLDIRMPEIDGFVICSYLKSNEKFRDIPIMFISASSETDDIVKGFSLGAVDYITKPFRPEEIKSRVSTHLKICDLQSELMRSNKMLQQKVEIQVKEIADAQMQTIFSLAKLAQSRDDDTGEHLERVRKFCGVIAEDMRYNSTYSNQIDDNFIKNIINASPLHDIGKVGIPDSILLKTTKLTEEEFNIMKTHTTIGARTLETVSCDYQQNEFIKMGILISHYHHERWDGNGYPENLQGTNIPLAARIMALVDVYDALRSRRVYKKPFTHEVSKNIIFEGKGSQFDPFVVEAFERLEDKFDLIWTESHYSELMNI